MSRNAAVGDGADPGSDSVQLTTHPDRSSLMHFLQISLKPLRPHLVAPPKKAWPAGSPRLDAHFSAEKKCRVEATCRQGVWSYELIPRDLPLDAPRPDHSVYYFAGGSFQNVPSSAHWRTAAELSVRLGSKGKEDNVRAHIVSPPLAPNSPAKDSLRMLRAWLEDVLEEACRKGWTVALAGDSSGGNLAATLAIGACGGWPITTNAPKEDDADLQAHLNSANDAAQQGGKGEHAEKLDRKVDEARHQSQRVAREASNGDDLLVKGRSPFVKALTHTFLVCPALDMRNVHPDIPAVGQKDPMLTPEFTGAVAECWRGAVKTTSHPSNWHAHTPLTPADGDRMLQVMAGSDPRLTPLLADISGLRDCDVTVDGLIAGLDSLSPDAMEFVHRLRETGVRGEWQRWDNMMHCWHLTWWGGFKEGHQAVNWMVERIKRGSHKTMKTAS